ncbi:hypothetical protein LJR125_001863 [Pseudoxanthomonas sp. LjRoot125]|uniref:hypothetical protein n=1 Tax=Pseudoxanthomonas sp. LjRoot125 TaxID=3342258 RepID=UPI003E11D0DF
MKALLLKLALPLLALASVSIWLNSYTYTDGFLLNLATELIGIVITVAYVDWVLKAHEKKAWMGTSVRIADRLRNLSNASVSGLRSSLGFGTEVLNHEILQSGDLKKINREVMRVGVQVLQPSMRARLEVLDGKGWKTLAAHLQGTWQEAERLLQFSHRLESVDIELLFDLQQEAQSALTFWRTFPDIAGVPDKDLPLTRSNTRELKSAWNDMTAKALTRFVDVAMAISDRSNAQAADRLG